MIGKTYISNTNYDIKEGKTKHNGTNFTILKGKTKINGVGYFIKEKLIREVPISIDTSNGLLEKVQFILNGNVYDPSSSPDQFKVKETDQFIINAKISISIAFVNAMTGEESSSYLSKRSNYTFELKKYEGLFIQWWSDGNSLGIMFQT